MRTRTVRTGTRARATTARARALGIPTPRHSVLHSGPVSPGDEYWQIDTVLGPAFVAYNEQGISALMRATSASEFEQAFLAEFGRPAQPAAVPPGALARAVDAYLRGVLSVDEAKALLRFDLRGATEFERDVLLKTAEIPYGEVRSYSWIAREVGRPLAVRAAGSAIGRNPVPLLIPCHRVVRRDGHIGEYGLGGTTAKRALLAAEGVDPDWLEGMARAGIRYVGNVETRVYCFPTCHQVRRLSQEDTLSLRSDAEAAALGYMPCPVCRPFGEWS